MSANGQLSPSELAPIAKGQLRKDAAAAWNSMNVEARRLGCELLPNGSKSSYRTYAQQVELWQLYQSGRGNLAAHPGSSNHGAGIAVDVATPAMRAMIDRIGTRWGWDKRTSDAPSEWWHLRWNGSWHGPDPGPYGGPAPVLADLTDLVATGTAVIAETATGEIFYHDTGERGWVSLGRPG